MLGHGPHKEAGDGRGGGYIRRNLKITRVAIEMETSRGLVQVIQA